MSRTGHDDDGLAARVVAAFEAGWRSPHPHAWDDLLAPEVLLEQPLLPTRRGAAALAEEYGRLLDLVPDLRGHVRGWSREGRRVTVSMTLVGTMAGRDLRLDLVDVLDLDAHGRIVRRRSTFDPLPAVVLLLRSPAAWPAWWRSGIGPFTARRALTEPCSEGGPPPVVAALALGRLVLALAAWSAPDAAGRLVGLDPGHREHRYLLRVFAGRAAALGIGTLSAPAEQRRRWQALGLLVDVSDTLAGAVSGLGSRARVLSLALTGLYAVVGAGELRRRRR